MEKPRGGNYYWLDNLAVTAIRFEGYDVLATYDKLE